MGKDGYTGLTDPRVEWLTDADAAMSIQDIVIQAFERCGPNYEVVEKREAIRQRRLALLNTSDSDRTEAGFIKLRPGLDGRLVNTPKPCLMTGPGQLNF